MKTKQELLKIYSAYLPYEIEIIREGNELTDSEKVSGILKHLKCNYISTEFNEYQIEFIKPILYSMDWLTKEIEHKGEIFVPLEKIGNLNLGHCDWISNERERLIKKYKFEHWFEVVPVGIVNKLIEWHFNVFGLDESEYIKKESLK